MWKSAHILVKLITNLIDYALNLINKNFQKNIPITQHSY